MAADKEEAQNSYARRARKFLHELSNNVYIYYGSCVGLIRKLEPQLDWDSCTSAECNRIVGKLSDSLRRLDMARPFKRETGDRLLFILAEESEDHRHERSGGLTPVYIPWLLYVEEDFPYFRHIQRISSTVVANRPKQVRRRIKLFEVYLLLFLKSRVRGSLRKTVLARIAYLVKKKGSWLPTRPSWKREGQSIEQAFAEPRLDEKKGNDATAKAENKAETAAAEDLKELALLPDDAWRLLEEATGAKPNTRTFIYGQDYRRDFDRLIETAPDSCYRPDAVDDIRAFLKSHKPDSPFFTLAGGPGTGKTTLIRYLLRDERAEGRQHPCFFIQMRHGDRDRPARVLGELAFQVCPPLLADPLMRLPTSETEALELFGAALDHRVSRRPLVVFLDGLDETEPPPPGAASLADLLRRIPMPSRVRFVISSRPTADVQALVGQFDVVLDESSKQNDAIECFYQDSLGPGIIQRIDFPELMRRTRRSFLYASLAVPDIRRAIDETGCYDVSRAPDSLEGRLEKEKHRLTKGPLRRGPTSRILALLSAHRGEPTFEEIAAFSRIEFAEVRAFFESHQHLFETTVRPERSTAVIERVRGFRHGEIERFLLKEFVGDIGIRRAHGAVVKGYLGSSPALSRFDRYAFGHLALHAALSDRPDSIFRVLTEGFVRRQLAVFPSGVPTALDCDRAIEVARELSDLARLIQYAGLRTRLTDASKDETVGLRILLDSRRNANPELLQMADVLGTVDDRILTAVEVIAQIAEKGHQPEREHVKYLQTAVDHGESELIEAAAIRLSDFMPDLAIRLAVLISEPDYLEDSETSVERPTRTRCVFRIIQRLADRDRVNVMDFLTSLVDTRDAFYAMVALGAHVLETDPVQAFQLWEGARDSCESAKSREWADLVFFRYALLRVGDMDPASCLLLYRQVTSEPRGVVGLWLLCTAFDPEFAAHPDFWREARDSMDAEWRRDFVTWRLVVQGLLPADAATSIGDTVLADLARAVTLQDVFRTAPQRVIESGLTLTSVVAAFRAIGEIIALPCEEGRTRAIPFLALLLESDELTRDWQGLFKAYEALEGCVSQPNPARGQLIAWCLDLIDALDSYEVIPVAYDRLAQALRRGWEACKEPKRHFFRSLISGVPSESHRFVVARLLFHALPVEEIEALAQNTGAYGLDRKSINKGVSALFLAPSAIPLLLYLSERIAPRYPQRARDLVHDAAAIVMVMDDAASREDAVSKLLATAMRLSPSFLWEIYDTVQCEPVALHLLIKEVLGEALSSRENAKEQFLRLELERGLHQDFATRKGIVMGKQKLVFVLTRCNYDAHTIEVRRTLYAKPWRDDFLAFVRGFVQRFRESPGDLGFAASYLNAFVPLLDWETYMQVARDPDIGPIAVKGPFGNALPVKQLRLILFGSTLPPDRLEEDLDYLSGLCAPYLAPPCGELPPLAESIMSTLAEYSPNEMIRFLFECPSDLRLQFRPKPSAVPGPYGVWKKQDVRRLFDLLDQGSSPWEALHAKAAWLQWLFPRTEMADDVAADLAEGALASCNPPALVDIGRTVWAVDGKTGFRLLAHAARTAATAADVRTLLRAIEGPGMEAWPEYRSSLDKAIAWAASPEGDKSLLARMAVLQSRVDWRAALRTLGQLDGNETALGETLDRIVDNAGLDSTETLRECIEQLSRIPFLDDNLLGSSAHRMVRRALDAGHTVSLEFIDRVRSPYWRMKCLRDFVSSNRIKGSVAVMEFAFAELERETAASAQPLLGAWLQLGAAFSAQRPRRAVDCLRRALHESSMRERDLDFAVDCLAIGEAWMEIPAEWGKALVPDFENAVRAFAFGREPHIDCPDMKFEAYFVFAACVYSVDASTFRTFLPELKRALGDCTDSLTFGRFFVETMKRVHGPQGADVFSLLLSKILDDVPHTHGQALADWIAQGLCETSRETERPLASFGIRTTGLPPNSLAILERLIARCSPSRQMEACLAAGISYAETDKHKAREYLRWAASIADTLPGRPHGILDMRKDAWLANAYLGSWTECIHAASMLARDPTTFERSAASVIACALAKVKNRKKFLLSLKEGLWTLEPSLVNAKEMS